MDIKTRERKRRQPRTCPRWADLPDLVMEKILSHLSIRDRYFASLVCNNWNRAFYSSRVWSVFVMSERTLTRRKFNLYMGYEHTLDHYRTQICLNRVGRSFRQIIIKPIANFFNLYEFMNMLSYFAEFYDDNPLRYVHTLHFTFACHLIDATGRSHDREIVFGTGGKLLQTLKHLMSNLVGLRHLALDDLLLERHEAVRLLDEVAAERCETLRSLRLVNCSRGPCPLLHLAVFVNLRELFVAPQQLDDEVVTLLGYVTRLRDVHLLQNQYTEASAAGTVSAAAWRECRLRAPRLRVHLRLEGKVVLPLVWQECAPVKSITYHSAHVKVLPHAVMMASDMYKSDLEIFGHLSLPRFYMPRPFDDRADSSIIYLCRQCPKLHTLIIRERISTATVLLIANSAKNLQRLIIRKNAIRKRADWPRNPEWSDEFYEWLCRSARSYESVEQEVSQILGVKWFPMSDDMFKNYKVDYSSMS